MLQRSVRLLLLPDPCQWLNGDKTTVYSYSKTFEEARYEPFVAVHTSGSTGMPKKLLGMDNIC